MGVGGLVYLLGEVKVFAASNTFLLSMGELGKSVLRLGGGVNQSLNVGAVTQFSAPAVSPAYLGVGYIIGPRLAALNFSGGVVAWGLLVPLLMYFLGPQFAAAAGVAATDWTAISGRIWYDIVRPIAVGGMLVGASFTLFKMRKNLGNGLKRAFSDLKKAGAQTAAQDRTEIDLGIRTVVLGLGATFIAMVALYLYFTGTIIGAVATAIVMLVLGFFFAAVSGNLVGVIGSSNNPISGLTLSTVIIAALLMVILGITGVTGVAAVLGVAAVICVSSAVAGEMLQDLKVGHILGGTPRSMQLGDFLGVAAASLLLYFPLYLLHVGNINEGGIGFGDAALAAPQAGLMATLSQGIVGGQMNWPLVVVGMMMGIALIMVQVKSPMLFSVGMYLPLETTFAIFVGGVIRWMTDSIRDRKGFNDAQKARIENAGVLTASGLIAGEALMGLVKAGFSAANRPMPELFEAPPLFLSAAVLVILAMVLIRVPLANAGHPDEPAPPTAMM
jgi:putative OPT family oligopeptide transporter